MDLQINGDHLHEFVLEYPHAGTGSQALMGDTVHLPPRGQGFLNPASRSLNCGWRVSGGGKQT